MNRKLVAFDIDGTLLDSNKEILASTLEVLDSLRKAGHLVTLATGRSFKLTEELIGELGFENYILFNGAAAFIDHELVYSNTLDEAELARLTAILDQEKIDVIFHSLADAKRRNAEFEDRTLAAMQSFNSYVPEAEKDFYTKYPIHQAIVFYNESEKELFESQFPAFRFVRWHENSVDVVPHNGSKANTLMDLAERYQFAREDVIAFGDGENDIEMLAAVGLGIVMGNASDEVKKYGDYVTDTNDADGIYKAAKKFNLI